ncbi:toll/interleukin-1 receptor domain-containing protein [Roseibium sp. HPY-6]|uniref:toll/interleukin-1 receptor domain-containing protein n=1 Tax=Roseibium sp. HPY-6 TaxID=3229852 RepID=UPI003390316C
MSNFSGTIFLSHASADKAFVETIYKKLDASSAFYDIKTINPGQDFIDAMKSGVGLSSLFVLFHSPNTRNTWVEFETKLAEFHNASTYNSRVLVCPIGGATYHSLPDWLKSFMTTSEAHSASDIARTIIYLQQNAVDSSLKLKTKVVGREEILNKVHLATIQAIPKTGHPIQHIVLSGIVGMGRTTIAKEIIKKSFSNMRSAGPIFDLPDMAEAVDFYIALKQDIDGLMDKGELSRQIEAFSPLSPNEQAEIIANQVAHWSELNQPIVFKTRWGLRDRSRHLKPWLDHFFEFTKKQSGLRTVFVSNRRLPDEEIASRPNVEQFQVEELSETDVQIILHELIESRYYDAQKASGVSSLINGHAATAHYTAFLINSGRNTDLLVANPDPIVAFQSRALRNIFSGSLVSETQLQVLALLGVFPKLSFRTLESVLKVDKKTLSQEVMELIDFSLVQTVDAEFFGCPDIVGTHSRRDLQSVSAPLLSKVKRQIEEDIEAGEADSQLITALLIATVEEAGEIPNELIVLLTSSSLLAIVATQFDRLRSNLQKNREGFEAIYKMAKLAMEMRVSDDAVEQILFTGGDSAIRAGIYPEDIIAYMESNALPAVYYLKGSYAFHVEKNNEKAIQNLKTALSSKHFKLRNTRLLVRAYIRERKFSYALDVLGDLTSHQLQRESGLLILKIRALRGLRLFDEASAIEEMLESRKDEYGEIPLFNAGKFLREMRLTLAMEQVADAKKAPKVNLFSCQLMECAIRIEDGDPSLLPATVEYANSVSRGYDALQLQARHAVVQGRWADAEKFLAKIERKDYFDLQIEKRCLEQKMADVTIVRDAAALDECKRRLDEVAVQSATSPEGFRDA